MKLLLSGEGPTDMGGIRAASNGPQFVPGPMAWIVDRLMEGTLNYSVLEQCHFDDSAVLFVCKSQLAIDRDEAPKLLPGVKRGKGRAHFTRNAELLALRARRYAQETQDSVVAILFRDSDGTCSTPRDEWQRKVESILEGFRRAEFVTGVAMVPRPKSEAWLICALKDQPYQHCDLLEDAPGNDASPNSLKLKLASLFHQPPSTQDQIDCVRSGRFDPHQLIMPSFEAFKRGLSEALARVMN